MDTNVELGFVSPQGSTDEDFEAFMEAILDELESIGRDDIEMTASLTNRTATFTVFGGDEEAPSLDKFLADLRTALHAANCATPGWEKASIRLAAEGRLAEQGGVLSVA